MVDSYCDVENMKKYQIKEVKEIYNHAGSKAVEDVWTFAGEAGYETLFIRQRAKDTGFFTLVWNQLGFLIDWIKVLCKVEKGSTVLVQNPFKRKHLGRFTILKQLKKIKKCNIISLVHDIEELRVSYYRDYSTTEFEFMKGNSDYFIIHNGCMKEYMIERGFDVESLVELGIFDYGFEVDEEKPENGKIHVTEVEQSSEITDNQKADVVIAGNLELQKCPYIYKIPNLMNRFTLELYGPNYEKNIDDEYIKYCGSFPSEEVPRVLNGRFGLIWDGDGTHTCTGDTGRYLRYNNPHKTSLYLVAEIPIIIWEKAALASFVIENGLGITVGSLEDIKSKLEAIAKEDYAEMLANVKAMAAKLRSGYHVKQALAECEKRIEDRGL